MSCLAQRLFEPLPQTGLVLRMLVLASLLAAQGCDLSDPKRVSLEIVLPMDDAILTSENDVDPTTSGTQIEVTVSAVGIGGGEVIELYRVEAGEPLLATIATAAIADSQAVFEAFTLRTGENQLQARVQGTTRTSSPINVKFRDTCGQLAFVEPSMSNEDAIRLGPTDDLDNEECGDTFTTRVIASTGLPDGSEVILLVNGRDNSNAMTVGGVAVFDQVVLDYRGTEANRLALRVASSECALVELDADVFVDCDGPSCRLGGPKGPALSSADDEDDMGAGLQVNFEIETDPDVMDVKLLINGDIDNAIPADVQNGKAALALVALPEGTGVRVKAVCTTEKGAVSTEERLFNVDTTPCAVAITTPLANTAFVAEQPSTNAPPTAKLETMLSADVGSDCTSVRFAALSTADCAGLDALEEVRLDAGQVAFNTPLILTEQGKQFVCVEAIDASGNKAIVNAPISFDKEAPTLAITEPATSATYGPGDDDNDATPECDVPMSVSCDENDITVALLTVSDQTVLATATCSAGEATFASVPLPSQNDGSAYDILARAVDANGLTGNSSKRSITADCEP